MPDVSAARPLVGLLPTGSMEHVALATSPGRLFPGVRFETQPPEKPLAGFTSCRLVRPLPEGETNVRRLARRLVADGERLDAPALVAVVDDLELCNVDQPQVVVDAFADAVRACFDEVEARAGQSGRQSCMAAVKQRCSFHLLAPMVEAYFFGDPQALATAGAVHAPHLVPGRSVEELQTDEQAYLTSRADATWAGAAWLHDKGKGRDRDDALLPRHPKRYLEWLARDVDARAKTRYREMTSGVRALETLGWYLAVAGVPAAGFAGALLCDIADATGSPAPPGAVAAGPTMLRSGRRRRALRNS